MTYLQALQALKDLGAIAIGTNGDDIEIDAAIKAESEIENNHRDVFVIDGLKVWQLKNGYKRSIPTCTGLMLS